LLDRGRLQTLRDQEVIGDYKRARQRLRQAGSLDRKRL